MKKVVKVAPWRMKESCATCPFSDSQGGTRQRQALRSGRMTEIKHSLLRGEVFWCHKTTSDEGWADDGEDYIAGFNEQFCAGALAWQNAQGVTSNFQRVMECLDERKPDHVVPVQVRDGASSDVPATRVERDAAPADRTRRRVRRR